MRYIVIKDGRDTLVWDSVDEQMYLSDNGEGFREVKSDLIGVTKFRPYAEIIEETNAKPEGIISTEKTNDLKNPI